jgi:RimJ/RimL family protein N-acetyltransferase
MIKGEKIVLRMLDMENEELLFCWINDPEIRSLSSGYWPVSVQEHRRWLEETAASSTSRVFGIHVGKGNELVGTCGFFDIHWQNRRAEMRIRIGSKRHWRQGIGSEAVMLLLRLGFNNLNLHRVSLTVFAHNTPAIALYEKLGFVREGRIRESVFLDGGYMDEILMGMIRTEWR